MVAPMGLDYATLLGGGGQSAGTPPPDASAAPSEFGPEMMPWKDATNGQPPILDEVFDKEGGDLSLLAQRVLALFTRYEQARADVAEGAWELSENLYDGKVDNRSFPYGSVYEIREVFRQVEASRALSAVQLFGQRKRFKYLPLQPEGEEDALRATAAVVRQLKTFRLNRQLLRWVSMPPKVGTSYLFEGWANYRRIKRKLTQLHDVDAGLFDRLTEEVKHGGPWLEWIDHWKMFVWPWIEDMEDQRCVFMRELVDGEYLRTMVREQEFDKGQVETAIESGGRADKQEFRRGEWESNDFEQTGDREFECISCWTSTGWVYTVVNDTIVQAKRTGFDRIPFRALKYYASEGCHYGISEPSILAAEQLFLRDAASMWIDSIHYKLQPMWVANSALKNVWKNHSFRPGGVIWVDGKPDEQIKALTTPQDTFQLQSVMETIRRYMQNDTSMTDEMTGLGSRHRTATGMMQLQQSASMRHKLKLIEWQEDLEQVYLDLYEMDGQFLNEDVFARVESSTGEEVPGSYGPQIFTQEVEVELNMPDSTESPALRQQRIVPFLQLAMQRPDIVNLPYVLEEAALAFEFRNPRKLVVNHALTQQDVFQELSDWLKYGVLADPLPSDDHQTYMQVYTWFTQSAQYQGLDEAHKQVFERHVAIREKYLEQMMAAQGGGGQQLPDQGMGPQYPVSDEANARTNAMTNNAQVGAQQQGGVAG